MDIFPFDNQFVTLGKTFFVSTDPTPVTKATLLKLNKTLANELGLPTNHLSPTEAAAIFSGNHIPDGAEPLAMAYAGHQFGQFNSQLGDGRAILLGEITDDNGRRFDMQLKGSGRTFYSRNGDGRAALGPVLREYLVSEAMEKLGIPTTRALAAVTTGEEVERERLLPGGIITRIATSFVRVGTFQYFSANGDEQSVQTLADHIIDRNYPLTKNAGNPYIAFFKAVTDSQASLIAQWMQVGFIHGVMNTDNMSIAGETIDYGPCAFMDTYKHDQVFSYIDRQGRYAYNNQPSIGLWNLTRLAESLLPLFDDDTNTAVKIAQDILNSYIDSYQNYWLIGMRTKFGFEASAGETLKESDTVLIQDLLASMDENDADFTLTFFHLSRLASHSTEQDTELRNLFNDPIQFDDWITQWRKRLDEDTTNDEERQLAMQAVNPVYIPRNHQIEAAIRAAEDLEDFSAFHDLHDVLQNPYVQQPGKDHYMLPPEPGEEVTQTFCGT